MDSDLDDLEDLNDAENALTSRSIRRPRIIRERPNHFNVWSDGEFYNRFRMSKQTARMVLAKIAPHLPNKTNWNQAVSAENMLLLTLRFYASGGMLITNDDFSGVSKSTASIVIKKVSKAICMLRDEYIKLPSTQEEINRTVLDFFEIDNFPRVVGALDCTHVRIQSPGGQRGEVFRNRKGFFSLNVQVVGDASLKVCDIVARWPGSSHDSTIFNNSRLCSRFESGEFGDKVLLGVGGYPSKSYLMVPFRNPCNNAQRRYNEAQIKTRNCIERLFGVWKQRFPVLALGLRVQMSTIFTIIVATAILHNICRSQNDLHMPHNDEDIERQVQYSMQIESNTQLSDDQSSPRDVMVTYFRTRTNRV